MVLKHFEDINPRSLKNYLDEAIILEELENEDLRKGEGSFSKVVNSMYSNKSSEEIKKSTIIEFSKNRCCYIK
ncbi:hypothetical protein OL548_33635 (plasmid) [Lysinibacillus sp. MHQ-1]|nr:hypothetical protein OL548_33635 [Lysinibacillus sp. MHQ-1]